MIVTLIKVHKTDSNLQVEFYKKTGRFYDENTSTFRSYISFLGRSKVSILIEDWDKVSDDLKTSIWEDIEVLILNHILKYITIYLFLKILIPIFWCKCKWVFEVSKSDKLKKNGFLMIVSVGKDLRHNSHWVTLQSSSLILFIQLWIIILLIWRFGISLARLVILLNSRLVGILCYEV